MKNQKENHQEETFLINVEHLLETQNKENPERVLFLSVVLQALLDATKPETSREPEEEKLARRSAQAWFFASIGVTSEDFVDICDLAGISPVDMRNFAFKILRSKEIKYIRKRINTVLNYE
jgi:hypothetical protein|tara:strand:- start:314 stop:676 length:363 start_codon:yes stop_codon:yes gene_type:complete